MRPVAAAGGPQGTMSWNPRRLLNAASLLGALGFGACLGGQTGGETGAERQIHDEHDTYSGAGCEEVSSNLAPDEVSPLGFGAADVLTLVGESTTTPMVWLDTSVLQVQSSVEPGPSELTITLLDSSNPRFVEVSPAEPEDDTELLPAGDCPDRVDVDVILLIATADGALDETVSATLHATDADFVDLIVPLDLAGLTGTFRASPVSSSAELEGFALRTTYEPAGVHGELAATLTETDGELASASLIRFAEWNGE